MNDKKGVIYILINPSFPDYVKVEYADDVDKRLKQLNRSECMTLEMLMQRYIKFKSPEEDIILWFDELHEKQGKELS